MATSDVLEQDAPTRGVMPTINDLVAASVVLMTYAIRVGVVEEGAQGWHTALLYLTTDFVLPVLAAAWLLALPAWQLLKRIE